jgi:hypothetical protein
MNEMIMNDNNGNAIQHHIVVVGEIDHLTDTQVFIKYNAGATDQIIVANRTELGASGSMGVPLNGSEDLAFSFKRIVCPRCEGNNDGAKAKMTHEDLKAINVRRAKVEETGKFECCTQCSGKGVTKDLPTGMNPAYEAEWDDVVQSLRDGQIPPASQQQFQSMLSGGRNGRTDHWDVEITRKALEALTPTGEMKPISPAIIQHFNEMYACDDMPHGMPIGRTKTHVYATKQHRDVLAPWVELCADRGLFFSMYGANHGQDAFMQIKLTTNGTKEDIFNALKVEGRTLDDEGKALPLSKDPKAMISFGIQIRSSFDGSISFVGIAERVACLNGMITTDVMNLLTVSHKKGAIDAIDFNELAGYVLDAALHLWDEISMVEQMNEIDLTIGDVERLAVIMAERGIISYPGLGASLQLTGGRVFRAMTEGWANPNASRNGRSFVAIGGDNPGKVNSLNHLYNIISGIITHQVDANDAYGQVGGGKAIGVDATQKNLKDWHTFCREVQDDALVAYAGRVAEHDAMSFEEYIATFGIPMLEALDTTERIVEISGPTRSRPNAPTVDYYYAEGQVLPTIVKNVGRDAEQRKELTLEFKAPAMYA